jgi:hypothetical protein
MGSSGAPACAGLTATCDGPRLPVGLAYEQRPRDHGGEHIKYVGNTRPLAAKIQKHDSFNTGRRAPPRMADGTTATLRGRETEQGEDRIRSQNRVWVYISCRSLARACSLPQFARGAGLRPAPRPPCWAPRRRRR